MYLSIQRNDVSDFAEDGFMNEKKNQLDLKQKNCFENHNVF